MTQTSVLSDTPPPIVPAEPQKSRAIPALVVALVFVTIAAIGVGVMAVSAKNATSTAEGQRDDAQAQLRRVTNQRDDARTTAEVCSGALDTAYYVIKLDSDFYDQNEAWWNSDEGSASETFAAEKLDSIGAEIDTVMNDLNAQAEQCDGSATAD